MPPARIALSTAPVLGETCNFLRNNVGNGPALESRFLNAVTRPGTAFEIVDPLSEDRQRAAELVGAWSAARSATSMRW